MRGGQSLPGRWRAEGAGPPTRSAGRRRCAPSLRPCCPVPHARSSSREGAQPTAAGTPEARALLRRGERVPSLPASAASQSRGVQRRRRAGGSTAPSRPRSQRASQTHPAPDGTYVVHAGLHLVPLPPSLGLGTSALCPLLVPRVRMAFVSSAITYLLMPSRAVNLTCFPLFLSGPYSVPYSAA